MTEMLELDGANVVVRDMSLATARSVDDDVLADVEGWIDDAQAHVFTGDGEVSYLVIRITRKGGE